MCTTDSSHCTRFTRQGFESTIGTAGVGASVRIHRELSHAGQRQLQPALKQIHHYPVLRLSECLWHLGVHLFKKGEKTLHSNCVKGVRKYGRNSPADPRWEKKGRRGSRCRDSPAGPGQDHGIYLQTVGNPHWRGSSRNCGLWRRAPTGAGFQAGYVPMADAACWSILFLEDCTPRKGPVLDQLIKDCLKQRRSSRDKELQTDHNPLSTAHCITPAEDVEESGAKLSFGRRKEWVSNACRFLFNSFYPTLLLTGDKFISLSQAYLAHNSN